MPCGGAQELVVASAASKMVASTATYPHEVLRSHMHIEGAGPIKGLLTACKRVRLLLVTSPLHHSS